MRIFYIFYTNPVFKHKAVVSSLHVCSNGLGKKWPSYIFHFSTRILNSTHTKKFNIFRILYVSMCNNFQLSIISKWLAKHISTNVSSKLLVGKYIFTLTLVVLEYVTIVYYLEIWNDYPTKMIVLPSFQLATRLNSQNINEIEFINDLWHIN